jgi:hypothetical protein
MTAYSVLQARVADWLNRTDLTSAQIDSFTEIAEGRFNRRIFGPDREVVSTLTTSTEAATLPTDCWGIRAICSTSTTYPTLKQMSLVELRRTYTGAAAGQPRHYTVKAGTIILGPAPSASTSFTLDYWQTTPALTSSNTSNWLIAAHPDIYLSAVLTEAYIFLRDTEAASLWDARTEAKIDELEKAERRKQNGAAPLAAQGTYRSIPGVQA